VKVLQPLHRVTQRCCRVKNLGNQQSRCYLGVVRIREEKNSRGERLLRNWIKFSEVFEKSWNKITLPFMLQFCQVILNDKIKIHQNISTIYTTWEANGAVNLSFE
jgi:hypothetical protein